MKIRVRCLRGIPIAKIQELARPYLERMERTGALTSIFNIFAGLIERKETCYILSGTLDSIAQAFRERHDSKGIARIACSSLEVNEKGRSTGRYKTFMFDQGKVVHGIAAFGEQVMRNATYYTDNLAADKDVCAYVKKVIHVGVMTE
jgi:phosphoserine phosphatase